MIKYLLVLIGLFTVVISRAQNPFYVSISNTTLAATDSMHPFWFVANQNGKIQPSGSFLNISELNVGQAYNFKTESKLGYTWGGDFVAAFGKTNYYQVNQAFAGFALKGWEIKGGMFYNEINYAGLSTSNGNIAQSQNARPIPRVRFSTMGYKPFFFAKMWFSFKFEYEEGFLTDERYVDGAHLHHKSLYGKIQPDPSWNFRLGLEHFAMWGGTSRDENVGDLPEGWNAYWHYVLAIPGGKDFPGTDQKNISGNQLGTYQLEFEKDFSTLKMAIYISHPWEDNSGLNWHNYPDNLIGLHLNFKKEKSFISDIVYEYCNTRQQGVKDSLYSWNENTEKWKMNEYDNYYNHGIYRSGFTYQQQVMSSPLFYPVIESDGISMGLQSNRFFSHHIGLKGVFAKHFNWKGMLTYIQHLGTWRNMYDQERKQISGLLEICYSGNKMPFQPGIAFAGDAMNTEKDRFGIQLTLTKRW